MNDELDIKLNKFGHIDTDYYIAEAHKMRSEYNSELIQAFKTKLKALFSFDIPKVVVGRHVHH